MVQKKQFIIIAQESQESSEDEADVNDSRHARHVQHGPPVILGCVILYLAQLPNAKHRAEVGKLIVGREHRKRSVSLKFVLSSMLLSRLVKGA